MQRTLCAVLMLCACSPQGDRHAQHSSQNTALSDKVPLYMVNVSAGMPYYTLSPRRGVLEQKGDNLFPTTTALDVYRLHGQQDPTWVVHRDDYGAFRFFRVPVSNLGRGIIDHSPTMYRASSSASCPRMSFSNHNQRLTSLGSTLSDQRVILDALDEFVAFPVNGALELASRHCFSDLTHSIFAYTEAWPPAHLADILKSFPAYYYGQSFDNPEVLNFVSTQVGRNRPPLSEMATSRRSVVRRTYQSFDMRYTVAFKTEHGGTHQFDEGEPTLEGKLLNEQLLFEFDRDYLGWDIVPPARRIEWGISVALVKQWIWGIAESDVSSVRISNSQLDKIRQAAIRGKTGWQVAIFDLLFGIYDRHFDNYTVLVDGRIATVDSDVLDPIFVVTPTSYPAQRKTFEGVIYELLQSEFMPSYVLEAVFKVKAIDKAVVRTLMKSLYLEYMQARYDLSSRLADVSRLTLDHELRADLMVCLFYKRLEFLEGGRLPDAVEGLQIVNQCRKEHGLGEYLLPGPD